jgi:thiol:disulfide interchange protein DsbD
LLGTVVTMLILAAILLALRAGGTAVGWGFQLQSPLVIAFLALIILGAALNLLGVFEVGLSMQRAGEISIERGAFARAALTGALSIIVATPCAARLWQVRLVMLWCNHLPWRWLSSLLALGFAAPFSLISSFRHWENGCHAPAPG